MNIVFERVYNQHKTKSQTWFMRSRFFNLRSALIVGNGLYMYKKNMIINIIFILGFCLHVSGAWKGGWVSYEALERARGRKSD